MLSMSACPWPPLFGQPSGPVSKISEWLFLSQPLRMTAKPPAGNTRHVSDGDGEGSSALKISIADVPNSHKVSGASRPAARAYVGSLKNTAAVENVARKSSGRV